MMHRGYELCILTLISHGMEAGVNSLANSCISLLCTAVKGLVRACGIGNNVHDPDIDGARMRMKIFSSSPAPCTCACTALHRKQQLIRPRLEMGMQACLIGSPGPGWMLDDIIGHIMADTKRQDFGMVRTTIRSPGPDNSDVHSSGRVDDYQRWLLLRLST